MIDVEQELIKRGLYWTKTQVSPKRSVSTFPISQEVYSYIYNLMIKAASSERHGYTGEDLDQYFDEIDRILGKEKS